MSKHLSTRLFVVLALTCAALISSSTLAGTISLAWNPVDHPDLDGYRVFYDTVPGAFGSSVDVGTATEATLAGLDDCTNYEVAAKAYNVAGVTSDQFSNTVTGWARPRVAAVAPAQVERNQDHQLVIDGANFQSGFTLTFSDPGIVVSNVIHDSCYRLRVEVSVAANAGLGPVDLQIVNPDQVFGVGSGLFSVVGDLSGPAISSLAPVGVGATTAGIDWQTDEPSDSTVHYRVSGGQIYQATPTDAALVTDHQVQLHGLRPESTYQYYVESTDASGNTTVSGPPQAFTTSSSPYVFIRFEAEDSLTTPPVTQSAGGGAFENGWIEVPAGIATGTASDPAGSAELRFHLPHTATWRLWARIHGAGPQNGSWFEAVDGAIPSAFQPPDAGAWHWVELRPYDLAAGLHTLLLGGHEDESRADRILVTDDPAFVPSEQPDADVLAPDPVAGLAATAGDGFNSLSWTNPAGESGIRVVLRYRLDGQPPLSPADGLPALDTVVTPGSAGSFDHGGLLNGTSYTYSVFVLDPAGNASEPATVQSTPTLNPPGDVENLVRTDTL